MLLGCNRATVPPLRSLRSKGERKKKRAAPVGMTESWMGASLCVCEASSEQFRMSFADDLLVEASGRGIAFEETSNEMFAGDHCGAVGGGLLRGSSGSG